MPRVEVPPQFAWDEIVSFSHLLVALPFWFALNSTQGRWRTFPMKFFVSLILVAVSAALAGNLANALVPDRKPPDEPDPPKHVTNSIGMKFVWIPPGTFLMGSPANEQHREQGEIQHKVTMTKGFYMGVHLVTQEQWQAVMGNNPSRFKGEKDLPVEQVSWEDTQLFIKKLREKEKKVYRLPIESEWEYACRAGTITPFHFGDTISTDQGNYYGGNVYGNGKKGVERKQTTPVNRFPANAWGLRDMHGNVFQWCQDWYGNYPQKDLVDPQGPNAGKDHVMRGGSWNYNPQGCRSAYRRFGYRSDHCGFRVCFFVE